MRRALPLVPIALFALAGCKPQLPYTVGGTELKNPARRIISMSPSATEVLALNGGSNALVGKTSSDDYPKFVARSKVPNVVTIKPNWELIQQQNADLIVYDPDLYSASDVAQMAKFSRLPPFPLGGDTLDEFIDNLYKLASMYTGESFMSEYVDKIVAARKAAQADPVQPTPTVAIVLPANGGEHMIAGKDSFFADEVRAATGNPVGPPGTKFVPLNAESLVKMDPDIIVTAGDSGPFLKDSRFQSLTAIKKKRVLMVDQDSMVRRGARVPDLILGLHNNFAEMMR